jgi:hypothetical protein
MDEDRSGYIEQLQAIHLLRDELELDDEAYRELLSRLTGLRSAKAMTPEQRRQAIAFMRIYRALDEAVAKAEEARETFSAAYYVPPRQEAMTKAVYLDGKFLERSEEAVESLIHRLRQRFAGVRLASAGEEDGGLRLDFATHS